MDAGIMQINSIPAFHLTALFDMVNKYPKRTTEAQMAATKCATAAQSFLIFSPRSWRLCGESEIWVITSV